jgi:hypothetical protein
VHKFNIPASGARYNGVRGWHKVWRRSRWHLQGKGSMWASELKVEDGQRPWKCISACSWPLSWVNGIHFGDVKVAVHVEDAGYASGGCSASVRKM